MMQFPIVGTIRASADEARCFAMGIEEGLRVSGLIPSGQVVRIATMEEDGTAAYALTDGSSHPYGHDGAALCADRLDVAD